MNRNQRRTWGFLVVVGSALGVACSVDTGGITFLDQNTFDQQTMPGAGDVGSGDTSSGDQGSGNDTSTGDVPGAGGVPGLGGAPDIGGVANIGGVTNIGGVVNIGGVTNIGGVVNVGGTAPLGGRTNGGASGAPQGGSGVGGQMQCPHLVANRGAPLIDDFEDNNAGLPIPMNAGRAGGWYTTNDGTGQQMPPPGMPPNPAQNQFPNQVDSSKYALHTLGGGFTVWGADVGVSFVTTPDNPLPCPYDISPHTGLRFSVRGFISDDTLRVSIPTVETNTVQQGGTCVPVGGKMCDDHYSYEYGPITNNWTVVSIPFSDFTQQDFGVVEPWKPAHALGIEFGLHAGLTSSFDLWIDNVQFY